MAWTPERTKILLAGITNKLSAWLIAVELGITRNAVISKARRMGFATWNSKTFLPNPITPATRGKSWEARRRNRALAIRTDNPLWQKREPSKSELMAMCAEAARNTASLPISI